MSFSQPKTSLKSKIGDESAKKFVVCREDTFLTAFLADWIVFPTWTTNQGLALKMTEAEAMKIQGELTGKMRYNGVKVEKIE